MVLWGVGCLLSSSLLSVELAHSVGSWYHSSADEPCACLCDVPAGVALVCLARPKARFSYLALLP